MTNLFYYRIIFLFNLLFLAGCSAMDKPTWQNSISNPEIRYNISALNNLIDKADFEASNLKIMREPEKWQGKIIAVSGNLTESHLLNKELKNEYREITGSYNNYLINIVCVFYSTLPRQKDVSVNVQHLYSGKAVKIIAEVMGVYEFITESGNKKNLPVARCYAVYNQDDRLFKSPLWADEDFILKQ